jgi:hypothetical protein
LFNTPKKKKPPPPKKRAPPWGGKKISAMVKGVFFRGKLGGPKKTPPKKNRQQKGSGLSSSQRPVEGNRRRMNTISGPSIEYTGGDSDNLSVYYTCPSSWRDRHARVSVESVARVCSRFVEILHGCVFCRHIFLATDKPLYQGRAIHLSTHFQTCRRNLR